MNKVFFVFVFSSRAFQTRVLSFFSIKKCWEKEQLEQPQLAGKQLRYLKSFQLSDWLDLLAIHELIDSKCVSQSDHALRY